MIKKLRPDQILARPDTIEWAIALQQAALSVANRRKDIAEGSGDKAALAEASKEGKCVEARIEMLKRRMVESMARG